MQEELKRHRRRELWRTTKAAVGGIVVFGDATIRAIQNLIRQQFPRLFGHADASQLSQHRGDSTRDLLRLRSICFSDAQQYSRKPWHIVTIRRREVGAAVERDTF